MRQLLWCAAAALGLSPAQGWAQIRPAALGAPGLKAYVREVLAKNAGLGAAVTAVAAAGDRIAPAGALPDPTVLFGAMSVPVPSFDFRAEAMTQLPIGIEQRFPSPGKLGAATAAARADSAVSAVSAGATVADLAAAAAAAFYRQAYAVTALAVWDRRIGLAGLAVQVAQTRYETGAAPQTDLLRARLRLAELADQRRQLEADLAGAEAGLDALRGGPGDSVVVPPLLDPSATPALEVEQESLPADPALAGQVEAGNPRLALAQAEITRAERVARVFEVAARPDFTVTLQQGVRLGGREPFLTGLVGIAVPLWAGRKQHPAARAARSEVEAARDRWDDLRARVVADGRSVLAELVALRGRVALTAREILPLADAARGSALQRYQVGAGDFTAVLDTEDDLFQAELRLARFLADYGAARARLGALIGEEWYR